MEQGFAAVRGPALLSAEKMTTQSSKQAPTQLGSTVIEDIGIDVSTIGPGDGPENGVHSELSERLQRTQRLEDWAVEIRLEVDDAQLAIRKCELDLKTLKRQGCLDPNGR